MLATRLCCHPCVTGSASLSAIKATYYTKTGTNLPLGDFATVMVPNVETCAAMCMLSSKCVIFAYFDPYGQCFLKDTIKVMSTDWDSKSTIGVLRTGEAVTAGCDADCMVVVTKSWGIIAFGSIQLYFFAVQHGWC